MSHIRSFLDPHFVNKVRAVDCRIVQWDLFNYTIHPLTSCGSASIQLVFRFQDHCLLEKLRNNLNSLCTLPTPDDHQPQPQLYDVALEC